MRVEVRGKVYKDVPTAAAALGVAKSTIYCAICRRTTETIGQGPGNLTARRGGRAPKPITIGSTTFPSMAAASVALGYGHRYVQQVLSKGKSKARQNLIRAAMEYQLRQDKRLR